MAEVFLQIYLQERLGRLFVIERGVCLAHAAQLNNMEIPLFNNQKADLSHHMGLGTCLNKHGSMKSIQQSAHSISRRCSLNLLQNN